MHGYSTETPKWDIDCNNNIILIKHVSVYASAYTSIDFQTYLRWEISFCAYNFLYLCLAIVPYITPSFCAQAFSVFFVCVAFTSDIICLLFIPVQWLFFAASTYVWVQYVWHTGQSMPLPQTSTHKIPTAKFEECWSLLWSTFMQREEFACLLCPCGSCLCTLKPPYGSKIWRTFTSTSVGPLLPTGKCRDQFFFFF